jgi:hypothetical protein
MGRRTGARLRLISEVRAVLGWRAPGGVEAVNVEEARPELCLAAVGRDDLQSAHGVDNTRDAAALPIT